MASAESDDDDYMSGAILEQATQYEKKRQKTYSERRQEHLREQQRKAYIKPQRELEEEKRQEGLKKQLEEDNKGMRMMMKMGFKQVISKTDIV
jgi:hypothetical protein